MPRGAIGRKVIEIRGHLGREDARWDYRSSVEIVSAGVDDDFLGLGSSPVIGDIGNTALTIPAVRTSPETRYLFRLASFEIPSGRAAVLRGIRQLLTLRAEIENTEQQTTFVFEREVVSPLWHFSDANTSWHIRWSNNSQGRRNVFDAAQVAGTSPSTWGTDSALLYNPPLVPYIPPGLGIPPGKGVEFLSTWRDMRYRWDKTAWDLHVPIIGPGVVTFYASVFQTDPDTRPCCPALPPVPFPILTGLRPEDQFLLQFPNCIYGHVGGALLVDLYPCKGDIES